MADIKALADAVSSALGVIKNITSIPGANLIPYVSTISSAIGLIQQMIVAGENIGPFVANIKATFSKPDVSPADMAALDAKITILREELDLPLPPPDVGEPD